jgi:hypothetical protein
MIFRERVRVRVRFIPWCRTKEKNGHARGHVHVNFESYAFTLSITIKL